MAEEDQKTNQTKSVKTTDKQVCKIQPIKMASFSENDPTGVDTVTKIDDNNIEKERALVASTRL